MSLLELLPDRLRRAPEIAAMETALGAQTDALRAALADAGVQLVLDTATWGLDLWEAALGLKTEAGKSGDDRRAQIRARLRGAGTVTAERVKNVAESYVNGEVEVTEQAAQYRIVIRFTSIRGIPGDMETLRRMLREIVPAHLEIGYQYTYTTWGEASAVSWSALRGGTWGALRTRQLI